MIARNGQANAVLVAATFGLCSLGQSVAAQEAPPVAPNSNGIIIALGEQDRGYADFARSGYEGVHEFECVVGVDCEAALFPDAIYHMDRVPSLYYEKSAVAEARIRFNLKDDTDDLILRLVRSGSETAIVQVDDQPLVELPPEMFVPPSTDGFGTGVFDLKIGNLVSGEHVVKLTMKAGTGNGAFGWDAVILGVGEFDE